MKLIDTHAHLDFDDYCENFDQILDEIKTNGVQKVIIPSVTLKDIPRIIGLIEKYDNLFGAVAIHPSESKDWDEATYESLKGYAVHPKVVAIGETGLDYYWDDSFKDTQKHVFREHIRLASEVNKPLIVHDRESHSDILSILRETDAKNVRGVMHCFSGSAEFAMECIKENFYIALGGPVTFKNAKNPKEVAQKVPLNRLLLETDSPFLAPHPHRGKANNPALIKLVAEEIANLRGISAEEVANLTSRNAEELFQI